MPRSKPTQASLSEKEIRDALEAAANHLSKIPRASDRLLFVAERIRLFLRSESPTLDKAFGLKRGRGQYERSMNEAHLALVCKALDRRLARKSFNTISELSGYSRKEFKRLWDRYLPLAMERLAANIHLDLDE